MPPPLPVTGPLHNQFLGPGPNGTGLFRGTDNHIHELYYVGDTPGWGIADLTASPMSPPLPVTRSPDNQFLGPGPNGTGALPWHRQSSHGALPYFAHHIDESSVSRPLIGIETVADRR